jgi:hypothetical protein
MDAFICHCFYCHCCHGLQAGDAFILAYIRSGRVAVLIAAMIFLFLTTLLFAMIYTDCLPARRRQLVAAAALACGFVLALSFGFVRAYDRERSVI